MRLCTPGFVLMTTQLLAAHPDPNDGQIRPYLSGNRCRCGTYPQIVEAVKLTKVGWNRAAVASVFKAAFDLGLVRSDSLSLSTRANAPSR